MPRLHQRQITLKDIVRYKDMHMKYKCLPWIAFSYSKIFTVVFWSAVPIACCAQADIWG